MGIKAKKTGLTVAVLLAIAALFVGVFVAQHLQGKKHIDPDQFHGTYLQTPRTINEFALTGVDGQSFSNAQLQGRWTLVFFGFTHCGYVCPTTMTELAKMYHILEEKKVRDLPQVVMISLDPQRDTQEKLKHYVTSFNPHFYGARGDESAISAMAHEMGIAYAKVINKNDTDSEHYDMQHSGAVMLFNPQGELNAFFTTPHRASLLAKDYILIAN